MKQELEAEYLATFKVWTWKEVKPSYCKLFNSVAEPWPFLMQGRLLPSMNRKQKKLKINLGFSFNTNCEMKSCKRLQWDFWSYINIQCAAQILRIEDNGAGANLKAPSFPLHFCEHYLLFRKRWPNTRSSCPDWPRIPSWKGTGTSTCF